MSANIPLLTPAQEQVIALLSNGFSLTAAAAAAGVHRNTITNWRQSNAAFTRVLATAQYDRMLHFRDRMEESADSAILALRHLLDDAKTPAGVRLKAALAVLSECTSLPPAEPAMREAAPAPQAIPRHSAPLVVQPAKSQMMHNSAQPRTTKVGRNERCPCHSGRKYKQCCLLRPQAFSVSAAA